MSQIYYNYFRGQWLLGNVTAEQLATQVPRRLTQAEYEDIINTPQPTLAPEVAPE